MKFPAKTVFPASSEKNVRKILSDNGFTFAPQDHAFWHAERAGTHVIFYKNGTVLFQGKDPGREDWYRELANLSGNSGKSPSSGEGAAGSGDKILGLDESGKGDYFGPLVLAGAVVPVSEEKKFAGLGVQDSKKLSDSKIKSVFEKIRELAEFRVRLIEPEEYNRLYAVHKNLNRLMMDEYRKLVGQFGLKNYDRIILDRFSSSDAQNGDLRKSLKKDILIVPGGEAYVSVALASVVARYHFVEWMGKKSAANGLELPIGSGPLAGELFRKLKNGADRKLFLSVAKAHFKSGTEADSLF